MISKWIWAGLAGLFAILQIAIIVWVVGYIESLTGFEDINFVAFGLRLLASLPAVGMLLYCVRQYGKEREYE